VSPPKMHLEPPKSQTPLPRLHAYGVCVSYMFPQFLIWRGKDEDAYYPYIYVETVRMGGGTLQPNSQTVLCPCCSDAMTIQHVCEIGDDQPDDQTTPSDGSPVTPQTPPDPPDPYAGLARFINARSDQMFRQIHINLGLPPPWVRHM